MSDQTALQCLVIFNLVYVVYVTLKNWSLEGEISKLKADRKKDFLSVVARSQWPTTDGKPTWRDVGITK